MLLINSKPATDIYFNQFQGLGYVILFHYGFGSYTVKVQLGSMYLENNQNLKHFL